MSLMVLFHGGYGAGIISGRDGTGSGSLPHFLGRWLGRLGSPVERHLCSLDSNHFTLHPHCCPFVFLQEIQEISS